MNKPSGADQKQIDEISALRQRIQELECSESERNRTEEVVQADKYLSETIINSLPGIFYLFDAQGKFLRWNRNFEIVSGYSHEEMLERHPSDFFVGNDKDLVQQRIRDTFVNGEANVEARFVSKIGIGTPYYFTGVRIEINGQPHLMGMGVDIAERKRIEDMCRDAEACYRALFEQSPNGVLLIDTETGKTIEANETASRQLGYTREEFAAMRISDYEALEGPEETSRRIEKVIREGSDDFETLHRTKGGAIRNVHVWVKSVRLNDRGFFYAIFQDITAEKRAEEENRRIRDDTERLAEEMAVIAEIGRLINSSLDIDKVYESFALHAQRLVPFDRLSVDLNNPGEETFTVTYVSGTDIPGRRPGDTAPIAGTLSEAIRRERTGLLINTASVEEIAGRLPYVTNVATLRAGMRSMISVPLISGDEVIGALHFRSKKPNAYTERDLRLGERIGAQIAGAIFNARIVSKLRKAVSTTIQVMVSAVDARDPYTAGHQSRSADLARAIAAEMGLPQEKIEGIRMAGTIHDIGNLSIPAEILSKSTKLLDLEFALIKEHARGGCEMLKDVESPWPLAEIVYQHHERMDGSGYPKKLKGEEILIEARILAVADVVEAIASHRPYRPALGVDAALEEIEKYSGIRYDNAVADACLKLFREKGFQFSET